MNKQNATLMIDGRQITVPLTNVSIAHGVGLDGKTKVESLQVAGSPEFQGKTFVSDTHGNSICTTADELLAATRVAAPGYEIIARKLG